jgi:hypothetical protein
MRRIRTARRFLGAAFLLCGFQGSCGVVGHCHGPGWEYEIESVARDGIEVPNSHTIWPPTTVLQTTGCYETDYQPYAVSSWFWLE